LNQRYEAGLRHNANFIQDMLQHGTVGDQPLNRYSNGN
jgi:hypothetical protein